MNTYSVCKNLLLTIISIISVTLLSGCGAGGGSAPTAVTLNSITVTPSTLIVPHGLTATLRAIGTYTDGSTADITTQVTWTSTDPSTVTLGNHTGSIIGTAVGTTTVTAAIGGIASSNTANINVIAASLSSIAITPASVSFAKGTNIRLTAIGTYSDGSSSDISTQVTWLSASAATATVGSNTGTVTGIAVGSTTAYASLDGITSPNANITVTDAVLNTISITAGATLPKGTTANLSASGTYSDSTTADITTQVTWTSAATSTATVGSHTGSVIGKAVGTTTISASLNGITSNTANIDVIAATLSSIAISPTSISLAKGTHTNLSATGTYSDASTADLTTQVIWTSVAPATAGIGTNTGVVLATAVSSTSISASLNGIDAPSISVTVTPVTWNPSDKGTDVTLDSSNLTATSSVAKYEAVRATIGVSSGTAFWEITAKNLAVTVGIMGSAADLESWVGSDLYGWGLYLSGGTLFGNAANINPAWVATAVANGSVVGFGLDMDAGTLRIWVDGVDKGIALTGLTGTIYPAITVLREGEAANFGATPFSYPQVGYSAEVFQH